MQLSRRHLALHLGQPAPPGQPLPARARRQHRRRPRRGPLGRRRPGQPVLHPRVPRPRRRVHRQARHRPRQAGPGRRLRDPRTPPRGTSPAHPRGRLPVRAQHRPEEARRPHQGLLPARQRWAAGTDRPAQPRPHDRLPPPGQDPRGLEGRATLPRHLRLDVTAREPLPRRPHGDPTAPRPSHPTSPTRPRQQRPRPRISLPRLPDEALSRRDSRSSSSRPPSVL